MKSHLKFWSCLVLASLFITLAQAQAPQTPSALNGRILEHDTSAKMLKVTAQEQEYSIKYDEKTKFEKIHPGSSADLAEGVQAKVMGELASDQSSIEATGIEILKADTKVFDQVRASENFVVGKLAKDGDAWVVTIKDKKIKVSGTDSAAYKVRENAQIDEGKPDGAVWIVTRKAAAEPTADRVQYIFNS